MSSKEKPPWRDEELLRRLYKKQDLTDHEIAQRFGCSRAAITKWRSKFGIESEQWVDERLDNEEKIRELYIEKKQSTYEIADQFDCCEYSVRKRLSEFGIERRSNTDYVSEILKDGDELERLYNEEHMHMGEIADLTDVTRSGVERWMKIHDIETHVSGPRPDEELTKNADRLERLYIDDGLSTREIAQMFDVSDTTIYHHLKKNGVEMRTVSEAFDVKESQNDDIYYGPDWKEKREHAIQSAGESCELCGMSRNQHKNEFGFDLHVHHIRKIRKFDSIKEANELDNLISVCVGCHRKWEGVPLKPDIS